MKGAQTPQTESRFTDTSTEAALMSNVAEDEKVVEESGNALGNQFDFGNLEGRAPVVAADTPATPEVKPETTPAAAAAEVDYKTAYADWMKGKGVDVDVATLGDDFGQEQMEQGVAKHYASQYVKDPMMLALAEKGLSIEDHLSSLVPLQQQLGMSDKDLYKQKEVGKMLQNDIILGKVNKDDETAVNAAVAGYKSAIDTKLENVPEDILKNIVEPMRQDIQSKIDELPNQLQEIRQQQQEAAKNQAITQYNTQQAATVAHVDKELKTNKNFGLPFSGQADKDSFKAFVDEQTKYGDITVKDSQGKEQVVQDIPFLHKLNSDQGTLLKVLRVMHALEKGTLTDAKNVVKTKTVQSLSLEPIIVSNSNANTQTSRFEDTSKGYV